MSDRQPPKDKRREREAARPPRGDHGPDFAAQMARAEFGRHYVDTGRVEQTLRDGEIVFRHRPRARPRES